jgi:hypothetical protein
MGYHYMRGRTVLTDSTWMTAHPPLSIADATQKWVGSRRFEELKPLFYTGTTVGLAAAPRGVRIARTTATRSKAATSP